MEESRSDDYIKRNDAINAFDDPRVERNYGDVSPSSVIDVIKTIQAADVVEIVRCKDCKYWGIERGYNESDPPKLNPQPDGTIYAECVHGPVEIGDCMYTDGDFYCAFGNRRTEK